jgi:hypothetical protein
VISYNSVLSGTTSGGKQPTQAHTFGAIGAYDGSLRAIVHAFKYAGCRSLAGGLGARLRESAADLLARADIPRLSDQPIAGAAPLVSVRPPQTDSQRSFAAAAGAFAKRAATEMAMV